MSEYFDDKRDRDRERIPANCPECGAPVRYEEVSGTFHVHGPADRKLAVESHGIEAQDGDTIRWSGLNAYCPNEDWVWAIAYG